MSAIDDLERVRVLLLGVFIPNCVKQKLEGDLRCLQQGSRPLQDHVREFLCWLSSVPHVAQNEAQRG